MTQPNPDDEVISVHIRYRLPDAEDLTNSGVQMRVGDIPQLIALQQELAVTAPVGSFVQSNR